MIITFSKKRLFVETIVADVGSTLYGSNIFAAITWARGRRVRFTIETHDAWAHGSRTSASGRHMRKASWEAHRDVMRALLSLDPDAVIRTGFATYRGLADFEENHLATGHKNVGSIMQPKTIRECSI